MKRVGYIRRDFVVGAGRCNTTAGKHRIAISVNRIVKHAGMLWFFSKKLIEKSARLFLVSKSLSALGAVAK